MKKITLLFTLIVLNVIVLNAKENQFVNVDFQQEKLGLNSIHFTLDTEVKQTSINPQLSNIERYWFARKRMYTFGIIGGGLMAGGAATSGSGGDITKVLYTAGGLSIFASFCYLCGSQKWLKRHSIEISNSGIVKRF